MIIESQDGTAIVVMSENSCLKVDEFNGVLELNFISVGFEITLGKFHIRQRYTAVRALTQIKDAFLRGDKYHKVAE